MGLYWRGFPKSLINPAKLVLGDNSIAIETGTYKGRTSKLLLQISNEVVTIEANNDFYRKAKRKLSSLPAITVLFGDSSDLIKTALPQEDMNCAFWLDAHFSGGNTAGRTNPCPLLLELNQILSSRKSQNTVIFIDDSRGLIGSNGWPYLSEITLLLSQYQFSSIIIDDVLIASSEKSLAVFAEHFDASRVRVFETLGGRMFFFSILLSGIGLLMKCAFKIKHLKVHSNNDSNQ